MKPLIVNLFAAAGAGKSTIAAGIFYHLKKRGINAELPREFAKDLTWAGRFKELANQKYVFGEQLNRIKILDVDVIVSDSPLLLSIIYQQPPLDPNFENMVWNTWYSFNNLNYLVERQDNYQSKGRNETIEEAIEIDKKIERMLRLDGIKYSTINKDTDIVSIVNYIIQQL